MKTFSAVASTVALWSMAYAQDEPCNPENNTFTVKMNLFAGELGYYQIEECGDAVNPTLGMELGETYTFVQADLSNYYHPMGFAYFTDGAHEDVDELEPGITQTEGNNCPEFNNCSAPIYYLNGEQLGTYNNIPEEGDLTVDEDNFGLDDYEPLFFYPMAAWIEQGEFSIKLKFTDEGHTDDIFYFCHIHSLMTGRIKLLKDGVVMNEVDSPEIPYEYDMPSEFDQSCGSTGLDAFQLPQDSCPSTFVCGADDGLSDEMSNFVQCIDAADCHMFNGMTTNVQAESNNALFMHQMIPHHENAVNMAKALLKTGSLECADPLEETDDCALLAMLYEIVNSQNFQVQAMQGLLEGNDEYPALDNCDVIADIAISRGNVGRDLQPANEICTSENNVFTVEVDLFAGELGYYKFQECGDMVNPTIGMEIGETYTFSQANVNNYYHPLGFAYFHDGAHRDVDELEPGITQTEGNTCAETNSCAAPIYYLNGESLATYNNIPEEGNITEGEDDFGLDHYEPLFFHPVTAWAELGEFSVKLNFDDADHTEDIFYFCHIHEGMTGRIKLLQDGVPVNDTDSPEIGYDYDMPSEFDESCGTFGLEEFTSRPGYCPDYFVCNAADAPESVQQFSTCIDAMNCHMLMGMTTGVTSQSEVALFLHQMIPHHQNAVNMAKALLKSGSLECTDVLEETEECVLMGIVYEIINTQNFQIQAMQGILESKEFPDTDNCDVPFLDSVDGDVPAVAPVVPAKPLPSPTLQPVAPPEQASADEVSEDSSAAVMKTVVAVSMALLALVL